MVQREGQPAAAASMRRWIFILLITGAAAIATVPLYSLLKAQLVAESPVLPTRTAPNAPGRISVSALGQLEPGGEIISLSAPTSVETVNRVEEVLVAEGDAVGAGQVVAVLDSRERRIAALEKSKTDVQVSRARLLQVKAGAQVGDVDAQKAVITRLRAELENAQVEYERNRLLYSDGAISASDLDSKRLQVESARGQLSQAEGSLNSLAEVRPEDVRLAEAELASQIAAEKQAQADLDSIYIRAPIDGQVITIHTRSGEVIDQEGILEIGATSQMYVSAEVYETDIGRVKVGQEAIITGLSFSEKLRGKVSQVGLKVRRQKVFDVNPTQNTDNRVIEVKIRLTSTDSQKVAGLSNSQVQVLIRP